MTRRPHRIDVHHHIIPAAYADALDAAGYALVALPRVAALPPRDA